jgi:hypothetical protein
MLHEELVFFGILFFAYALGMKRPDTVNNSASKKAKAIREHRKSVQKLHEDEYQQSLIATKEKIFRVEGPDIRERLQDDFRQYYLNYKKEKGVLPQFPEEDVWKRPDFKFGDEPKPLADPEADKAADKKGDKGKKDKKDGAEEEDLKLKFNRSEYMDGMQTA